jgi:hypothetical protein
MSSHTKRKRPETNDEVIIWFENLRKENVLLGFDDSQWEKLIQNLTENFINGDNLLSLTSENLYTLGITRIGPQRTLLDKIEEIKRSILHAEGCI